MYIDDDLQISSDESDDSDRVQKNIFTLLGFLSKLCS